MRFKQFIQETFDWCTKYLKLLAQEQKDGKLELNGQAILYPNILLVTDCKGYYVAELIGAVDHFDRLRIKKHKEKSIYRYFSQFDDSEPDPVFCLNTGCIDINFACVGQEADFNAITKRFPQIELYDNKLNRIGGHDCVFSFGENFTSCAIFNSILVNKNADVYRCKNILSAYIVTSGINSKELTALFNWCTNTNVARNIHAVRGDNKKKMTIAGQLQSMYLFPSLRETTTGEFINLHPEIVKQAFKTEHFEYEPHLEWVEHDGTCDDKAINPDLMVKRTDGFYDIYDLKTALLTKDNLTKGGRRRRFIDCVEEGIAQLANYREYFEYDKNAELAKERYGIVVDNPQLVLVVGSFENAKIDEINQACRRYEGATVIDYDTVCQMFLGKSQ